MAASYDQLKLWDLDDFSVLRLDTPKKCLAYGVRPCGRSHFLTPEGAPGVAHFLTLRFLNGGSRLLYARGSAGEFLTRRWEPGACTPSSPADSRWRRAGGGQLDVTKSSKIDIAVAHAAPASLHLLDALPNCAMISARATVGGQFIVLAHARCTWHARSDGAPTRAQRRFEPCRSPRAPRRPASASPCPVVLLTHYIALALV